MKIAIPVLEGRLASEFKLCKQFDMIDTVYQEIKQHELLTAPLIDPWLLPQWFQKHGVDLIIAGNMNERIVFFFQKAGIKVITGAPSLSPKEITHRFLTDRLVTEDD